MASSDFFFLQESIAGAFSVVILILLYKQKSRKLGFQSNKESPQIIIKESQQDIFRCVQNGINQRHHVLKFDEFSKSKKKSNSRL